MLAVLSFAQLLHRCAPNIGPRTMTAIVRVESDGQPLAIHDNTLRRTFVPHDANQGVVWANQLLGLHHSVDLGLAQINSANLPRLGMSVREAFDPCSNLRGGATILAADYSSAVGQFGAGQYALRRAIGAYNTGSLFEGASYIAQILQAAGLGADDDFVPDLAPLAPTVSFLHEGSAARLPASALRRYAAPARPPAPAPSATPAGLDAFHSPILVTASDGSNRPAVAPHPILTTVSSSAVASPNAPVVLAVDRAPIVDVMVSPSSSPLPRPASSSTPVR